MHADPPNFYVLDPASVPAPNSAAESSTRSREGSAVDPYTVIYGGEIGSEDEEAEPTDTEEDDDEDEVLVVSDDSDDDDETKPSWSNLGPPPRPTVGAGQSRASRPQAPRASGTPAAGRRAQRDMPTGILVGTWRGCKIDADQRRNGLGNAVYCSIDAKQRMRRRVAKTDHHGHPVLLESLELPKSSYCKHEDVFYLPRYRSMSKEAVKVAVRAQLRQAQRLARARGGTTAFGADQGGLPRAGHVVIGFDEQGRPVEEV